MLILLPMNPSSNYFQPSGVAYVGMAGVRWNLNAALPEPRADHRKSNAARPDEIVIG